VLFGPPARRALSAISIAAFLSACSVCPHAVQANSRADPSGRRYVVACAPDISLSDLPVPARRLPSELDALVVLLLPDTQAGSLRIGVSVPQRPDRAAPATAELDRVLAVTGWRGGGSAAFAQGGGAQPDDLPAVAARIWAALGLDRAA
jgi:alanyl-tRNA synthetase